MIGNFRNLFINPAFPLLKLGKNNGKMKKKKQPTQTNNWGFLMTEIIRFPREVKGKREDIQNQMQGQHCQGSWKEEALDAGTHLPRDPPEGSRESQPGITMGG